MTGYLHHPASFKDPAGFVYRFNNQYYRQVNEAYAIHYDLLMGSGLYDTLTKKKLLLPHSEIPENITGSADWYKTLLPLQLPFVSYAYEWSFDQLKDAALLTLRMMKTAIAHGMILKDATSFNIQFVEGRAVFIDTLSFEKYDPSKPWIAYRQFCECFLFPLYLGHYLKTDLQQLLSVYLEGIPAAVTAKLLPAKSMLNMGVWLHVYLQNKVKGNKAAGRGRPDFDQQKLTNLLQHLENIVTRLTSDSSSNSVWSNYYQDTILSQDYLAAKEKIFRSFIEEIDFHTALDAGANDGHFSLVLAEKDCAVVAIDFDSRCINNLYRQIKKNNLGGILPLCIDIANPSPATGFMNTERQSFIQRAPFDLVNALALIHHLVLGRNIPVRDVAAFLNKVTGKYAIIEFVPLTDPKAKELISHKSGYHEYDVARFEQSFEPWFHIEKKITIPGTERILYRLKKNNDSSI